MDLAPTTCRAPRRRNCFLRPPRSPWWCGIWSSWQLRWEQRVFVGCRGWQEVRISRRIYLPSSSPSCIFLSSSEEFCIFNITSSPARRLFFLFVFEVYSDLLAEGTLYFIPHSVVFKTCGGFRPDPHLRFFYSSSERFRLRICQYGFKSSLFKPLKFRSPKTRKC